MTFLKPPTDRVRLLISLALIASTLLSVAVAFSRLTPESANYLPELIGYALLIGLTVALSIPVSGSQLSLAHAGGMLAFLSLPISATPALTLAMLLGASLGGAVVLWRGWRFEDRVITRASAYTFVFIVAQVTLSFSVASTLYSDFMRGTLPLVLVTVNDVVAQTVPLSLYVFVYLAVYVAIFTLQLYSEANMKQAVHEELGKLSTILLLPVPFALVGTNIARRDESVILYGMTMTAATLIVFVLYTVSGSERRWRRQAQELGVLSLATQAMRGNLDLESLIRIVYVQVSQLLDVRNAIITLQLDSSQPPRYALIVQDGEEQASPNTLQGIDQHALIQHVLAMRHPLLIKHDVTERAIALAIMPPDRVPNSWLGVPLLANERVIGVISVSAFDNRYFTESDLRLLNILSASAGIAIDNARLYTQQRARAEQLATLNQVTALLTETLSPSEVLDTIVSSAGFIADSDGVAVYVYPQNSEKSVLVRHTGLHDKLIPYIAHPLYIQPSNAKSGIIYQTHVEQTPLPSATRDALLRDGKQAVIELPLLLGGQLIGVIALFYQTPQPRLEEQHDVLQAFCSQVTQAITNARAYESTDKALAETLEKQKAILNAMEEGLILFDSEGRIALANPRVDLVGLRSKELLGESISGLLGRKDRTFVQRLGFHQSSELLELMQAFSAEVWSPPPPHTYDYKSENTVYTVQRQIIPIRDNRANPIGVLIVLYNKTEERELALARESFTQMIVHDLRSPLTAVTTSLRLLTELVPKEADFRTAVDKTTEISRRAIRKVLQRVDAMLDIAKLENGEMALDREPTAFAPLAESVKVELSPLAQELEILLTMECQPDLPLLNVDADKTERLLLNLVDNALKYAPMNSEIFIRATRYNDGFVRVDVVDSGAGIPDDYKTRLFERFTQVQGRQVVRRGVGLGLNFCRLVSEAHGGNIWVEDNPTGGSVFSVTLPVFTPSPTT